MKIEELEVGKKYGSDDWEKKEWVKVLYVGKEVIIIEDENGGELTWSMGNSSLEGLTPYEEPLDTAEEIRKLKERVEKLELDKYPINDHGERWMETQK